MQLPWKYLCLSRMHSASEARQWPAKESTAGSCRAWRLTTIQYPLIFPLFLLFYFILFFPVFFWTTTVQYCTLIDAVLQLGITSTRLHRGCTDDLCHCRAFMQSRLHGLL
ncbi:hypothetical protein BCV70DRAFT_94301 [Testicularia cyperi]|uniref:Uncharacterized protein n=1 Tax=Testicularia cyperi TaxID=1882483 RepID=A0A317XQI8_9BASI|nr:hypothetical protein BCV70DRAFT_94301 [Testicularia cyperi]